jgi:hypothetical protein
MYYGVGVFFLAWTLHRITDKMDQFQYKEILETVMLPHAQENLPENW